MKKEVRMDQLGFMAFFTTLFLYITVILLDIQLFLGVGKYIFVVFIFAIFFSLAQKRGLDRAELILFSPFILLILLYAANIKATSIDLMGRGAVNTINQLTFFIIIYVIYNITWEKYQIRFMSYLYYLSLPILLALTFLIPGVINTNTIGGYIFFLSFFPLLYLIRYKKSERFLPLFVGLSTLIIIFATQTRSIQLSMVFGLITFGLWSFISRRRSRYDFYFLIIVAIILSVTIIYPNLNKLSAFTQLEGLVLNLTGKRLFSGRNRIWMNLLEAIRVKPWLGHGSGASPSDFFRTSLSAHNLYLQVGLQTGMIGVFLLLTFLFFIWRTFLKNRADKGTILASSFFVSILVYQIFEVSLTQKNFGLGLLQWLIIGFGLNNPKNRLYKRGL